MGGLLLLSSQIMPISGEKSKSKSSSSCSLRRRNSGRRAKHQAAGKALSTGDLHPSRYLRSKSRSSFKEQTGSLNETWDDAYTTSSVSERAASSCELVTHARHRSVNFKDNKSSDCSEILHRPKDRNVPPKPSPSSGASDTTTSTRSKAKAGKHVHVPFACSNEISYEVTSDDIKNSWLDIDVSSSIESTMDENQDMTVSFGPTGRFTMLDMDLCKNGKSYMVLIQQNRLVNEMLGQRTNHRRSVLAEQARQKREGAVDTEKLHAVASNHSKWGVELVSSSWWLCRA